MVYHPIKSRPGYINPRIEDIRGQRFGAWTVVGEPYRNANRQTTWPCRCDCGTERDVVGQPLKSGKTKSCGCKQGDFVSASKTKHGQAVNKKRKNAADVSAQASINKRKAPKKDRQKQSSEYIQGITYKRWLSMKRRVKVTTLPTFTYYGARGITVCDRWASSFENFLADMGECPEGLTLDRFPNRDGNYEPGNCRWATASEQALNKNPRRKKT